MSMQVYSILVIVVTVLAVTLTLMHANNIAKKKYLQQ